jgi:hypothetical protein
MLQAFKANLKDNQLEWVDDQPISNFDEPRAVYVIFLEESPNEMTLAALKEIETEGGKVFENVEELISKNRFPTA